MKKIVALILILSLISVYIPVFGETYFENQGDFFAYLDSINKRFNRDNLEAQWTTYRDYDHQIIYGRPQDVSGNNYALVTDKKNKFYGTDQPRYLGYNYEAQPVTNTYFPPDATSSKTPMDWTYEDVDGASGSWDNLDSSQKSHVRTSKLSYSGQEYDLSISGSTTKKIGSDNKFRVLTAPGWSAGFSGRTEHYGGDGKRYYATLYGPGMAKSVNVSCMVTTPANTYTIKADQNSITVPVTVAGSLTLNGANVSVSQIKSFNTFYDSKGGTPVSGKGTVSNTFNKVFSRTDYTPGSHPIELKGSAIGESIFSGDDKYPKDGSKTITLIVEPATAPTVVATPTLIPQQIKVSDADIAANKPISVSLKNDATLIGCSDLSKLTKWTLHFRKDPSGAGDQYQSQDFTSGLSAATSATKIFTVPAGVLATVNTYTQAFAVSADATVNGQLISSGPKLCYLLLYKESAPPPDNPPEDPPKETNKPPVAILDAPYEIRLGEDFDASGYGSYDEDGEIVSYTFGTPGATLNNNFGGSISLWYNSLGKKKITLSVKDDDGARAGTSQTINVVAPVPYAKIGYTGALKENRLVTLLDQSSSPSRYPIDPTKTVWTITPVSGGTASDIKYSGGLTGISSKDTLYKKAGKYKITLSVTNSTGYTATAEKILDIAPDLLPVADFNVLTYALRKPDDNVQASIQIKDLSSSLDGDTISQRVWKYKYDSDNDGSFADEAWVAFDSGNNAAPVLKTFNVGKYLFYESVTESFGLPTIPAFVSSNDYRAADTTSKPDAEKTCEVINAAPSVDFYMTHNSKIDVQLLVDADMATSVQNNLALLQQKLAESHVDANITIDPVDTVVSVTPTKQRSLIGSSERNGGIPTLYSDGDMINLANGGKVEDHTGAYTSQITAPIGGTRMFLNEQETEVRSISYSYPNLYYYRSDIKKNVLLASGYLDVSSAGYTGANYLYALDESDSVLSVTFAMPYVSGKRTLYAIKLVAINTLTGAILCNKIIVNGLDFIDSDDMTDGSSYCSEEGYGYANTTYTRFIGASYEKNMYYMTRRTRGSGDKADDKGYLDIYNADTKVMIESRCILSIDHNDLLGIAPMMLTYRGPLNMNSDNTLYLHVYRSIDDLGTSDTRYDEELWGFNIGSNIITPLDLGQSVDLGPDKAEHYLLVEIFGQVAIYDKRSLSTVLTIELGDYLEYWSGMQRLELGVHSCAVVDNYVLLIATSYNPGTKGTTYYSLLFKDGIFVSKTMVNAFNGMTVADSKWGYYMKPGADIPGTGTPSEDNYGRPITVYDHYIDVWDTIQPRTGVLYDKLVNHQAADPGSPSYSIMMLNKDLYPEGAYNVARAINSKGMNVMLMAGTNARVQDFKNRLNAESTVTNVSLSGDMPTNINAIADFIIKKSQPSTVDRYVVLNEALQYESFYNDYELDPLYAQRWKFTHTDPNCFDNSLGVFAKSGQYLSDPVTSIDKVGKFDCSLQVRDNPKDDGRFDNYRLWSQEVPVTIYVHRRPIAQFALSVQPGSGKYIPVLTDTSYDLDHTSRIDKGITAREWMWKYSASAKWNSGLPTSFDLNTSYDVQLRVQDIEGAWSAPTVRSLNTASLPPFIQANPSAKTWTNVDIPVMVTASDPDGDYNRTNYCWSTSTAKPASGWSSSTAASFSAVQTGTGIWYLHLEAFDNAGNSYYMAAGPYQLDKIAPTIDCSPVSYSGSGPVNIGISSSDTGGSGVKEIWYEFTNSTAKPSSGWSVIPSSGAAAALNADGTWYLHMQAFDNAGNSYYGYRGAYELQNLKITDVSIAGYWNHWRGQVNMFGKQMSVEPHRFLSLECVKIDVNTQGDPDKVVIRFSPELEAMSFTDPKGNTYDYNTDFFHYYVDFPQDSTFIPVNNHVTWEYNLPLAPSTKDWDDVRKEPRYKMTVTAWKGTASVTYTVDDIDITGNTYDLSYIQPVD